jgi:hypothetical protein
MGARRPVAGMPIVLSDNGLLIASPGAEQTVPASATAGPCKPTGVDAPRLLSAPGDEALALGAARRAVAAVDERLCAFTDETVG